MAVGKGGPAEAQLFNFCLFCLFVCLFPLVPPKAAGRDQGNKRTFQFLPWLLRAKPTENQRATERRVMRSEGFPLLEHREG